MRDDLPTRETLIARICHEPDEETWEEFLSYYREYLNGMARRTGLNHHDAEEVVQNVCLKIWEALPNFEYDPDRGRFRSWLATIISNEVRMLVRKRKRTLKRLGEHKKKAMAAYLEKCKHDISDQLAEEEWQRYVMHLAWEVMQKSFGERPLQAFELLSKDMPAAEVAKTLGLSVNSVYVYKKRVQDRLRAEVQRLNRELD